MTSISTARVGVLHRSIAVIVLEKGRPLAFPHSMYAEIRSLGSGRYSHWGNADYLSTSDNSDPRTNGRTYTFSESAMRPSGGGRH